MASARLGPVEVKCLITFTDSRQGTARMAVRMQQEAERSRLRGSVEISAGTKQKQPTSIPNDRADVMNWLQGCTTVKKPGVSRVGKCPAKQNFLSAQAERPEQQQSRRRRGKAATILVCRTSTENGQ